MVANNRGLMACNVAKRVRWPTTSMFNMLRTNVDYNWMHYGHCNPPERLGETTVGIGEVKVESLSSADVSGDATTVIGFSHS